MKLKNNFKVCVRVEGEGVPLTLRRPTTQELNEFLASRYDVRGGLTDNSINARCEFFDLLLTGVEDLEDDSGPITVDRKDEIPSNWKNQIIFQLFETVEVEKN
jgi:hypothetical protein